MGCKSAQGCAEGARRVCQGAWVVALGNGMVGGWSGCGPTVKNRQQKRGHWGWCVHRLGFHDLALWEIQVRAMWVRCPFQWRWSATRAIPAVDKAPPGAHG